MQFLMIVRTIGTLSIRFLWYFCDSPYLSYISSTKIINCESRNPYQTLPKRTIGICQRIFLYNFVQHAHLSRVYKLPSSIPDTNYRMLRMFVWKVSFVGRKLRLITMSLLFIPAHINVVVYGIEVRLYSLRLFHVSNNGGSTFAMRFPMKPLSKWVRTASDVNCNAAI